MMAGNPSWWSMMMNGMHPHEISSSTNSSHHHNHQFVYPSLVSDDNSSSNPNSHHHHQHQAAAAYDQDFPVRSWSQLLLGGDEGRGGGSRFNGSTVIYEEEQKKYENWELDQVFNLNNTPSNNRVDDHVKQEAPPHQSNYAAAAPVDHGHNIDHHDQFIHANIIRPTSNLWSTHVNNHQQLMSLSSPNSSITTSLSGHPVVAERKRNRQQYPDHECDSSINGGASNKKARVQQTSSSQPVMKVRKEKLMDRITAIHQIVSPFGKTDTASVLSEAIAYIRFLQGQIEALSTPYMRNNATESTGGGGGYHTHQHSESAAEIGGENRDLRSRGLCLVPISCTQHVGISDNNIINGADYWASAAALGGNGF